mgnify:CR=1 FL=1
MKKSLFLLVLCVALALCLPAQAEYYARVYNADTLNIRSGPGSDYPWLGSVPRDGQVRVVGESGNWYQIVTLDGLVTGYMSKNYLTTNSYSVPSTPAYSDPYASYTMPVSYGVVTDTNALNVRSGPGTEYTLLGSIAKGEWVEISGESGNWYYVTVVDRGLIGFVSKNYVSQWQGGTAGGSIAVVQNPAGTRFLNLRAYPSYDAQILDIFYNGEMCTVINRQSDGWVYVLATKNGQSLYGYFRGEYLTGGGSTGENQVVNTWQNGGNGRSLNLRSEPSTSGSVIANIPNGSTVQVLLKGSKWWQVMHDGATGFVDSGFLGNGGGQPNIPGNPGYNTATVQTGNSGRLNMREQANSSAKVLGRYENGTPVTILQVGSTWCQVQVYGQTGYMMTKYLSIKGTSITKQVVNNNGGTYVNLRTSPNKTSGNINLRVPVGSQVQLLAWGQEWSQVQYNGKTGYMMSWFLK